MYSHERQLICLTVDNASNVTFTDVEGLGNGERQWMSLHYTVNNATGAHYPI
jgi:hypothetical protein